MISTAIQHEETTHALSQSWLARLIAFIAWLFGAEKKLKRIRHATTFKPDWRDRYAELLPVEWHRDQMLAQGAALLLAGKTLADADYQQIPMPANYGGPCPKTPFEIARRWLAITEFLKDPEAHILRHAQRIAKRAGAAHHAALGVARRVFSNRSCLALILSSRRQAASPRANREGVLPGARAPPARALLPTAHSPHPQRARA